MMDSYQMTAYTDCAGDMLEVEALRKVVKNINKNSKWLEEKYSHRYHGVKLPRYRIKLQGRGPRTIHAIADGRSPRAYDSTLPIRHAERLDVYIHQRSEF